MLRGGGNRGRAYFNFSLNEGALIRRGGLIEEIRYINVSVVVTCIIVIIIITTFLSNL